MIFKKQKIQRTFYFKVYNTSQFLQTTCARSFATINFVWNHIRLFKLLLSLETSRFSQDIKHLLNRSTRTGHFRLTSYKKSNNFKNIILETTNFYLRSSSELLHPLPNDLSFSAFDFSIWSSIQLGNSVIFSREFGIENLMYQFPGSIFSSILSRSVPRAFQSAPILLVQLNQAQLLHFCDHFFWNYFKLNEIK